MSEGISRRNMLVGASVGALALSLGAAGVRIARADEEESVLDEPELPDGALWFLDVVEPYQAKYFGSGEYSMGGDVYYHCMRLECNNSLGQGWALFNLKGSYRSMSFVAGHIDGENMYDVTYTLEGDGVILATCEVLANDLPFYVEVPLEGVKQLRIYANEGRADYAALGNIMIYPVDDVAASTTTVVPDGDYPVQVDDGGATVTVTVSVSGNQVVALDIDSATGSASPAAISRAFTNLIKTQGVKEAV
jgi:hypothetical protein